MKPVVFKLTITLIFLMYFNLIKSQTVCAGSNFTINAPNLPNLTNKTYSLNPSGVTSLSNSFVVSPTASTAYTVYTTGTNSLNLIVTTASIVLLQVLPQPIVAPTYTQYSCGTFTNGFDFHLTFNPPTPVPSYTVLWWVIPPQGNLAMPNGITSSLQYSLTGAINPGFYGATILTSGGCLVNQSFTMQPIPTTTLITISATPSIVCAGDSTTLTASGASSYTWANGSAQSSITIVPSYTNEIYVTGFNTNTCVGTRYYYPSFYTGNLFWVAPEKSPVCIGETVVYSLTTNAASYTWIAGSNSKTIALTPTVYTTYTANTISTDGCKASFHFYVYPQLCTSNAEDEFKLNGFFKVFPNPVKDKLVIKTKEEICEVLNLTITSMIGQVVYKKTNLGEYQEVDLSFLADGVYYVTLKTNDSQQCIKIIKE